MLRALLLPWRLMLAAGLLALLTGGVASSQLFRDQICAINQKRRLGLRLYFGQRQYAGDNAAGVALIGRDRMMKEKL